MTPLRLASTLALLERSLRLETTLSAWVWWVCLNVRLCKCPIKVLPDEAGKDDANVTSPENVSPRYCVFLSFLLDMNTAIHILPKPCGGSRSL